MEDVPIPLLAGVYTDGTPVARVAYPVNLVPVPGQEGVADAQLRPAEGVLTLTTGQGFDRGGIVWTGAGLDAHYRVSGTDLIKVTTDGAPPTVIGPVGGSGPARMHFSFDRLGILSNGLLFYWDNTTLVQVTDPDIPTGLIDMVWIDGYFLVTDGTDIVATELADPLAVNPTAFSGTDRPDPIQCLLSVVNELTVVSRHFIDTFDNVGGTGFPFARVSSAVITKGAVGQRAACVFNDAVAFVGGGLNEEPSVYMGRNGQTIKIATVEIDNLLAEYTIAQLETITMDVVFKDGGQYLFIHLPDRTVVYDAIMSKIAERPVWHFRTSALQGFSQYKAQNITRVDDVWVVGDPASTAIGVLSDTSSQQYGVSVRWEFSTLMLRNGTVGATLHELNLFALTGYVVDGVEPLISCSYSEDGENFSVDRFIRSGRAGEKGKKLMWLRNGKWENFRIYRFRGDSVSRLTPMALNARISPLRY